MQFNYQSKLALMLTSAGSQRKLAALLGVTHQKIGRWLREGKSAQFDSEGTKISIQGATKIPEYAHPLIDHAFEIHSQIVADQRRVDHIPASRIPVYQFRPYMRNGIKGDRVFSFATVFISDAVRHEFLLDMARSKRYVYATVRSIVNFSLYTERVIDDIVSDGQQFGTRAQMRSELTRQFFGYRPEVKVNVKQLIQENLTLPIYTKKEAFGQFVYPTEAVKLIEKNLRIKHSPAALKLSDEYILQLYPPNYVEPKPKKRGSRTALKRR